MRVVAPHVRVVDNRRLRLRVDSGIVFRQSNLRRQQRISVLWISWHVRVVGICVGRHLCVDSTVASDNVFVRSNYRRQQRLSSLWISWHVRVVGICVARIVHRS